jgi:altronate dehydratase
MQLEEGPCLRTVSIQNAGGTTQTVRQGVQAVQAMLPEINRVNRSTVSAGHIVLGLECGGSDGYSVISVNPALGKRGSVCGFKPVPTLKLATHTEMYRRMRVDMDVNCGLIIDGKAGIEEMGETIFGLMLGTASGKKSKSETFGFGDNEFVPWHIGAVM